MLRKNSFDFSRNQIAVFDAETENKKGLGCPLSWDHMELSSLLGHGCVLKFQIGQRYQAW